MIVIMNNIMLLVLLIFLLANDPNVLTDRTILNTQTWQNSSDQNIESLC